jgi:hypothetical protein
MDCPRCKFTQHDSQRECLNCGYSFPLDEPLPEVSDPGGESDSGRVDGKGWVSLLAGFLLAIFVLRSGWLTFLFHPLITIIHELGHTIVGWAFGYPSIPAFDFQYGGGVTIHEEDRKIAIVIVVFLALGFLVYRCRKSRTTVVVLLFLAALYSWTAFTDVHQILGLFMGHGTELIIAGIFLYRAISGSAILEALERPLYAFVAFFILFEDIRFSYQLSTSQVHRIMYEDAKGGGHWMDFSRISEEFLGVELSTVAVAFLICCILTPIAVVGVFKCRHRLGASWTALVHASDQADGPEATGS